MICKEIVQLGDICINYSALLLALYERDILWVAVRPRIVTSRPGEISAGMSLDNCLMTVEVI